LALAELSDDQLVDVVREHGTQAAAARSLGVAESTFRDETRRRGLSNGSTSGGSNRPRRGPAPKLTRESLHQALQPPNNCKVRAFLDGLDDESRQVVDEALAYDKADFASGALRDWLVRSGFREPDVPGSDAINDHRAGRRPCRCRG
jgi:hypothetical protein